MRLVICAIGRRLNLANSTCSRRLNAHGLLTEIVELHGSRDELTDEQLEAFIARFPIEQT